MFPGLRAAATPLRGRVARPRQVELGGGPLRLSTLVVSGIDSSTRQVVPAEALLGERVVGEVLDELVVVVVDLAVVALHPAFHLAGEDAEDLQLLGCALLAEP